MEQTRKLKQRKTENIASLSKFKKLVTSDYESEKDIIVFRYLNTFFNKETNKLTHNNQLLLKPKQSSFKATMFKLTNKSSYLAPTNISLKIRQLTKHQNLNLWLPSTKQKYAYEFPINRRCTYLCGLLKNAKQDVSLLCLGIHKISTYSNFPFVIELNPYIGETRIHVFNKKYQHWQSQQLFSSLPQPLLTRVRILVSPNKKLNNLILQSFKNNASPEKLLYVKNR